MNYSSFTLIDSIRSSYDKCSPSECSGAAGCVTIYQHRNHRGWYQCYTIRKGQCEDFEAWWHESGPRVSSVNTHDTCIRLHSELGCKGQYIQVQPGSSHHGQLNKLQFEDRAVSVSSCDTTLSDGKYGSISLSIRRTIQKVEYLHTSIHVCTYTFWPRLVSRQLQKMHPK